MLKTCLIFTFDIDRRVQTELTVRLVIFDWFRGVTQYKGIWINIYYRLWWDLSHTEWGMHSLIFCNLRGNLSVCILLQTSSAHSGGSYSFKGDCLEVLWSGPLFYFVLLGPYVFLLALGSVWVRYLVCSVFLNESFVYEFGVLIANVQDFGSHLDLHSLISDQTHQLGSVFVCHMLVLSLQVTLHGWWNNCPLSFK